MTTVKLEVFDPPMCCFSGVCGPNVDPKLVQFSAALDWLGSQGVHVERYNPSHQYDAFAGNPTVVRAITEDGLTCLPLILANGSIISRGEYPSREALAAMAGLSRVGAPAENLGIA
jgi:hypothetical protein